MRTILHVDLNSCYASIESIAHPEYRDIPMAVGGEEALRHGIILAKNDLAKKAGVRTGEALWQARAKCPKLLILPPNYPLYTHYCRRAQELYLEYTDMAESFGPDECWLDVTGSGRLFGTGESIARELRERVKRELCLTVSIGVSWNKTFAKFGSDYRKPDAVTIITPENYKRIVWTAPVSDLLFVGPANTKKLYNRGIYTIGDLACTSLQHMHNILGKHGEWLFIAANGMDPSPVRLYREELPIKSVGNSTTPPHDICNENDARLLLYGLADSVASRLRAHALHCTGLQIHLRDTALQSFERQLHFGHRVSTAYELYTAAMELLLRHWDFSRPLRTLGLRAICLCPADGMLQLSMFPQERRLQRKEVLESTADSIRERFGQNALRRCSGLLG